MGDTFRNLSLFLISSMYVFSIISVFQKQVNQLFMGNELMLILILFILIFFSSSILIMLYDMGKYYPINRKCLRKLILIDVIFFIICSVTIPFTFPKIIEKIFQFLCFFSITLLFSLVPFILSIGFSKSEPSSLKKSFNAVKWNLSVLLKGSQVPPYHKNLGTIFDIAANYNEGMKEIKNSFGEVIHLNEIDIINLSTKKSIEEILDELTFSIPYYIFHGEIEQMKEMDTHIENINKCLGDIYSIAGGQFVTEILRMNGIINQYFTDNFFEFSKKEKYGNEFYKKKIFLVLLSLISSIIIVVIRNYFA